MGSGHDHAVTLFLSIVRSFHSFFSLSLSLTCDPLILQKLSIEVADRRVVLKWVIDNISSLQLSSNQMHFWLQLFWLSVVLTMPNRVSVNFNDSLSPQALRATMYVFGYSEFDFPWC